MSRTPLLLAVLCACCGDDGGPVLTPLFPENYAATLTEGRNCRPSADHDLNKVRVLADVLAFGPYVNRDALFPEGALLVKEEYDFADGDCSGEIVQWTVMSRLALGASLELGEWRWQRVDRDRNVLSQDDSRCFGCHMDCVQPDGFESTCAVLP
jgi:hypothetical protein